MYILGIYQYLKVFDDVLIEISGIFWTMREIDRNGSGDLDGIIKRLLISTYFLRDEKI